MGRRVSWRARATVAGLLICCALRPLHAASPLQFVSSTVTSGVRVPTTATIGLSFDGLLQLGVQGKPFSLVSQSGTDTRVIEATDVYQVLVQGSSLFVTPRPSLHQGRTYTLTLPADFFLGLSAPVLVTFAVRAEDERKPVPLFIFAAGQPYEPGIHSGIQQSKPSLDSQAPSVQFSKRVMAVPRRKITFNPPRGAPLYTIDAADSTCGTGGTTADACVMISPLGSKVTFFPRGILPGGGAARPAPWATAAATYRVSVEAGAFTDASRPGAVANPTDVLEFHISVSMDVDGPQVARGVPAETALDPQASSVFLTFNERVQAGDSRFSITAWNYGGKGSPYLLAVSPSVFESGWRQTVVLSFNAAVQSGLGNSHKFEVYNASSQAKVFEVPMQRAIFVGHQVLLAPSPTLLRSLTRFTASKMAFFVRASSPDAIRSADFAVPMLTSVDTKGKNVLTSVSSTGPSILWSSTDKYVCLPGKTVLPNISLYMNQALGSLDFTKTIRLYDCSSLSCGPPGAVSGSPLWSLKPQRGELPVAVDFTSWPLKATLLTGSLPDSMAGGQSQPLRAFRRYRLVFDAGLFRGAGQNPPASALLSLEFATCQVEYDTPSNSLVRVYSPNVFAASGDSGARRFQVQVPQTSVKDVLGNFPAGAQIYNFNHEADLPEIDPVASNPANGQLASIYENVVLAFNEVVQLGTGKIEIWAIGEGAPSFNVDVAAIAAASVNGHNAISGRRVSITPKTLCDGSPACGDLVVGKTYYVKTSKRGVFKDVVGNHMAQLDTSSSWKWAVGAQDSKAPGVAFVAGYKLLPPTGIYPYQLTGYIYFTERIVGNPSVTGKVYLQDCGKDYDCAGQADNAAAYLPAEVSFADGSSRGGAGAYGLMKFTRYLTKVPRKYKLILTPYLARDVVTSGSPQTGPASKPTLEVDVGQVPAQTFADSSAPRLARKTPRNTAIGVDPKASLVMNFNEDIQRGSGIMQLCLNNDATDHGDPACLPGRFADGSPAKIDIDDAILGRRQATFNWPKPLAFKQKVYVLIPSGFVKDVAGNPNFAVFETVYSFSIASGDVGLPTLDYYIPPVGASGALLLHFSEAMQMGSGVAILDVSANASVNNLVASFNEKIVTIRGAWVAGTQYRFDMSDSALKDPSGNMLAGDLRLQTFQTTSSITRLPAVGFTSTAPFRILSTVPANGTTDVVPSGTFKVVFSSAVQAGIGDIVFGTEAMPIRDCVFVGNTMICSPGNLKQDVEYKVTFAATAVRDSAGNALAGSGGNAVSFVFATVDADFNRPQLMSVSSGVAPFVTAAGPALLARGAVLSLTFSETVQAGSGSILVNDCSPGNPSVCWGKGGESVKDSLFVAVNVQSGTSNAEVFFNGSTVYVACPLFTWGGRYSVQTSLLGTFADTANQPLAQISSGFEFIVVPADTTPPTVLAYAPRNNSVGEVSPSADIRLYFSEAVQAVAGSSKTVTISSASSSEVILAVGGAASSGTVKIYGSTVVINPYYDMPYGGLVSLTIANGSFADFSGNPYAGIISTSPYKWRSTQDVFSRTGPTSKATEFPARHGMAVHHLKSGLMIYGGRKHGGQCYAEAYRSTNKGAAWTSQTARSSDPAVPLPAVAYPASAVDASDCVWLVGGQCSGNDTAVLWRTCTAGAIWQALPTPVSSVPGIVWPSSFSSVAIAIVGGWQLVVLDLTRGHCWLSLDKAATKVVRTADQLPFAPRRSATLMSSSTNDLFLVGGNSCNDVACSNSGSARHFTDVWRSAASVYVGRRWVMLTAEYTSGVPSADRMSVGRRDAGVVMTRDDAIFLLGGRTADGSKTVATVFASQRAVPDKSLRASPLLMVPMRNTQVVAPNSVSLFFDEAITIVDESLIQLVDLGQDRSVGGVGVNADSEVPFTKVAVRQVLRMTRESTSKLLSGRRYQVVVSNGALADIAGNKINGFVPHYFTVHPDTLPPTITMPMLAGRIVAPWTALVLEANEAINIGSGSLELYSAVGSAFRLPVSAAKIEGFRAFFKLPQRSRLTEGQEYTARVPQGLLQDLAGNVVSASSFKFTVLSGVVSSSLDGYSGTGLVVVEPGPGNPADITKPAMKSIEPLPGATDVPTNGVAIVVRYSEQVLLRAGGEIVLADARGKVKTFRPADVVTISNGVRILLPTLRNGSAYTLSIPDGAIVDARGNPAPASSTAFTSLSGVLDKTPPIIAMTQPANAVHGGPDWQTGGQIAVVTQIGVWFSEPIVAGKGNITINHVRPLPLSRSIQLPVESPNIIISGAKMLITLPGGALPAAGDYTVQLPKGVVRDVLRGSDGGGGNDIAAASFTFSAAAADTTAPSLVSSNPRNEAQLATPSFGLPVSASIQLTFTEIVQAGAGSISFVAHSSSKEVRVLASGADVTFANTDVVITSPEDFAPGEIYSVRIENSAVADVAGNSFAGFSSGAYKISTAPLIRFARVGVTHFNTSQKRYLVNGVVDTSNNIYAVGGIDHAAGTPVNDVWQLRTQRPTHCASSFNTSLQCSRSTCEELPPKELSGDRRWVIGGDKSMGTWTYDRVVWRRPSTGGRRCGDGEVYSNLGDTVEHGTWTCPCPQCPMLSKPLPEHMVNNSYTDAYSKLLATGEARPMLCPSGHMASGNFYCRPSGSFSAVWQLPYPVCKADPCLGPPQDVVFQDPRGTDTASPCVAASASSPVSNNTVCPMKCKPGYKARGNAGVFRCALGLWVLPVCEPRECSKLPTVTHGKVLCPGLSVEVGLQCQVICDPGYRIVGKQITVCEAKTSQPESQVQFTQWGTCVAHTCGQLKLKDTKGLVLNYTDTQITGSVAAVGCKIGYTPSARTFNSFSCLPEFDAPEVSSAWVGSLSCTRGTCNRTAGLHKPGYFTCEQAFYDETCQLECPMGFALQGGSGKYLCNAAGDLIGKGACLEVNCDGVNLQDRVKFAKETDCPDKFNSTTRCNVRCQDGYTKRGYFSCYYGGFSQMPACIAEGAKTNIKRFTLSSMIISFSKLPKAAAVMAMDKEFRKWAKYSIADSLNEVKLHEVVVDSIMVLDDLEQSGRRLSTGNAARLWIAFKVRAENASMVGYWLGSQQALTKARLQASFHAQSVQNGAPGVQISRMVFMPPRAAVEYVEQTSSSPAATTDQSFVDRLLSTEDQDAATVLLGCIVGIFFGLAALALCCRGGCIAFIRKAHNERVREYADNPDAGQSPLGDGSFQMRSPRSPDGAFQMPFGRSPRGEGGENAPPSAMSEFQVGEPEPESDFPMSGPDWAVSALG